MAQAFEDINDNIVSITVNSRSEAVSMKKKVKDLVSEQGKSVAVLFENRFYSVLAPGQDPYQIRKEIEEYRVAQAKAAAKAEAEASSETTSTKSTSTKTKKSLFSKK